VGKVHAISSDFFGFERKLENILRDKTKREKASCRPLAFLNSLPMFFPSIIDELAKSLKTVMLDLIQHPEAFEITGFLLSQEGQK